MPTHALHTPVHSASSTLVEIEAAPAPRRRNPLLTRLLTLFAVVVAVASLGACTAPHSSTRGAAIANYAKSHIGSAYVYGAAGPSTFDCSGLVQYSYRQAGIPLARTSYSQAVSGRAISTSAALPGDIVVLGGGSHVGIYVGNGWMVDAPHSGAVVTERPIYAAYSIRRAW